MPMADMKYWQECILMDGGTVRPPVLEMQDEAKSTYIQEVEATGLPQKARLALTKNAAE